MEHVTVKVKGLRCEKCAASVQKALNGLQGTANVSVTYESMAAVLDYDPEAVDMAAIRAAITDDEKGFSVA
jgi:copper chaperone CopZ